MDPTLAANLAELWSQWIWPIILLAAGLGLVIFVHELGHYLAAVAVGIKVERFALGFGPRVVGFHIGETDFCVKAIPLGGYIKMLGQEDAGKIDESYDDPRAFVNKTVGQRMLVISGGVIMNVIAAAILFIIVCAVGIAFTAPVVGETSPGFPAAEADITWQGVPDDSGQSAPAPAAATQPDSKGLQPGDEIVEIDGDLVPTFKSVILAAIFSDPDTPVAMTIERKFQGRRWIGKTRLGVKVDNISAGVARGLRRFGIAPAADLEIADAGRRIDSPLVPGDRIVRVAGTAVQYPWEITPLQKKMTGKPVDVRLQRPVENAAPEDVTVTLQPQLVMETDIYFLADGTRLRGRKKPLTDAEKASTASAATTQARTAPAATQDSPNADDPWVAFESKNGSRRLVRSEQVVCGYQEVLLSMLGLVPRLRVEAVETGSGADDAGVQPGDVIAWFGDRARPTFDEFRKTTAAADASGVRLEVIRDGKRVELTVHPSGSGEEARVGVWQSLDIEHLIVATPVKGSAAWKHDIVSGTEITAVNDTLVHTWIDLYHALAASAGKNVTLSCRLGDQNVRTVDLGILRDEMFRPSDYSFRLLSPAQGLRPLTVEVHKGPLAAIPWGIEQTRDLILEAYATLFGLARGDVSPKLVSGPVGITQVAIYAGRESTVQLVYLMATISCFLAVMNFLPLPVFDGGIAALLVVEKIRGKPLPAKVTNAMQIVGLVLIGCLFLAVTFNDIMRIFGF